MLAGTRIRVSAWYAEYAQYAEYARRYEFS